MHTFIQKAHKHILFVSLLTVLMVLAAWLVHGYLVNNSASASWEVDVSLSIMPYPAVLSDGWTVWFLLYYKTVGNQTAGGIEVEAILSDQMTIVSATPQISSQNGNVVTWTNLPDNYGPVLLEVEVSGQENQVLDLQGEVRTTAVESNTANNSRTASVTIMGNENVVQNSDLFIELSSAQDTYQASDELWYVISYGNNGPDTTQEAIIMMTIPDDLIYVSSSLEPSTMWDDSLVRHLYDIPSGESKQIAVNMMLSNLVEEDDNIFTYITVSGVNNDNNPINNQSDHTIKVWWTMQVDNWSSSESANISWWGGAWWAGWWSESVPIEQSDQQQIDDTETQEEDSNEEPIVTQLPKSSWFLLHMKTVDTQVPENVTCAWVQELQSAYTFAYNNDITTMSSLTQARMCDGVIRSELAKMMSNYAINILEQEPDTSRACIFSDLDRQPQDLQEAAKTACQLGLMGLNADGTVADTFNPTNTVDRATFATAFSRLLYGDTYNNAWSTWYDAHLQALYDNDIITNTIPSLSELRWYIMIMMQRSAQ